MQKDEIRRLAIESANRYYRYKRPNGEQIGIEEYAIKKIEKRAPFFYLYMAKAIAPAAVDFIMLKIGATTYGNDKIKIIEYDKTVRVLKILPNKETANLLEVTDVEHILIISDLHFLIKRVELWFREKSEDLALPSEIFNIEINELPTKIKPSPSQSSAIRHIFENPCTYIWGAPGTGKTSVVLAQSVLHCLCNNCKVLILAPTNNALEQTLYGVLSVLTEEQINIDIKDVLRLGVPSEKFYKTYPEVCENNELAAAKTKITNELEKLNNLKNIILRKANFTRFRKIIMEKLSTLEQAYQKKEAAQDKLNSLKQQIAETEKKVTVFDAEMTMLLPSLAETTNNVKKYSHGLFKNFKKEKLSKETSKLEILTKKHSVAETSFQEALEMKQALGAEEECLRKICYGIDETDILPKDISKALSSRYTWLPKDDFIITKNTFNNSMEYIKNLFIKTEVDYENKYDEVSQSYPEYREYSEDEIEERIKELENELSVITVETNRKITVLAATIDTYIARVSLYRQLDKNPINNEIFFIPGHIFMDEAGYCSVIKALTVLQKEIPLTFLGDHMQLPPICEADKSEILNETDKNCLFMWDISALYADEFFFDKQLPDLLEDYQETRDPSFSYIKRVALDRSHRFGINLAKILAQYVYKNTEFIGDKNVATKIEVINAPRQKARPGDKKRTNYAEVNAIHEYIAKEDPESYAILSPYKNQVAAIKSAFEKNKKAYDSIFTIHASQGREWDTVIISVVDTSDKYFTNTQNFKVKGIEIINTAISRARKKLVIVCDADYWITQQEQLIQALVSISTAYSLN